METTLCTSQSITLGTPLCWSVPPLVTFTLITHSSGRLPDFSTVRSPSSPLYSISILWKDTLVLRQYSDLQQTSPTSLCIHC